MTQQIIYKIVEGKLVQKFIFSLMALILGFCNFFSFQAVFAASDFNTGASDFPLRVGNATQSTGTLNWGTSLSSVNQGDELKFSTYYHNASNSAASNATVTLSLSPSGSSSSFTAQAQIAASGFNTYTSNASINLNQAQTISLANTAKWYHNYNGSAYQVDDVSVSVSGNTATVNLGTINSGYAPNDGYIVFSGTLATASQAAILTAYAGADQSVKSGDTVQLNASGSSGNGLSYAWTCSNAINLNNANIYNPTFIAPTVNSQQVYTCALTVTNTNSNTASDAVNIIVNPQTASTAVTGNLSYSGSNISAELLSPTDNKNGAVVLNAKVTDCDSNNCKARFIWGSTNTNLTNQTNWIENVKEGGTFSYPLTGLQKGEIYYAGLEVQMGSKTFKISGNDAIKFITTPDKPTSLKATLKNNTNVELNWKMGDGGDKILIKRGINTCPTALEALSPTVYYGEGQTIVDDNLASNTSYCYRAWMVSYDGLKLVYSDPAETLISTKATATASSTVKNTTLPQTTLSSKNEVKQFSLKTSARNTSTGEAQYRKTVTASANDNVEFYVEIENTGDAKLENIIVKNLIGNDLTVKNVFVNNVSYSSDTIEHAYIKELAKGEIAKINFSATMKEYEGSGSLMVVTEVSADGLNPMTDTVNVQKTTVIAQNNIEAETMEASLFSTIMAGDWFPWSILALILLVLLIVYFSLKEERKK